MINFSVAINLKCGFTKEVVKSIQEAVRSWQWSRNLHKELKFYPFCTLLVQSETWLL